MDMSRLPDSIRLMPILHYLRLQCWKFFFHFHSRVDYQKKVYKEKTGKELSFDTPKTLNEKIIWLKWNDYRDYYTESCDKYLIRKYLNKKFPGEELCPPLLYATRDVSELSLKKIERFPCIIKVSNGSGMNLIVRDRNEYSDSYLQKYFKCLIYNARLQNYKAHAMQYLSKNEYIVVEELLTQADGGIPNDYKLLYANGRLLFVYCSVDRLGSNVRQVYDKDWNRLHFIWVENADKDKYERYEASPDIPMPVHFNKMMEISEVIARDFPLVRVDFYDMDSKLYIGEITLHHGSGIDAFYPDQYDAYYGSQFDLPQKS